MDKLLIILKKYNLTPKQYFIIKEFSRSDVRVSELADILSLSTFTIHGHMNSIRKRLSVRTNTGIVVKAHKIGIIDFNDSDGK